MSISHLFSRFDQLGITLQLQDNHLKVQAPKGKLTPDLVNELKEKKDEIIGFLKKHVQKKEKYEQIEPVEKKEYYRLSSAQQRLYILYQLNEQNTGYNMPSVLELQSEDSDYIQRLEQTFIRLVNRHESFRTSFTIINEEPVQRIQGKNNTFRIINRYPPHIGARDQVTGTIKNFIRPFDLSQAPLLRVGLLPLGEKKYVMMVDMHHIISDGMSIEILIMEFMALQQGEAENTLPGLKLQYRDYSEWQRQHIEKETVAVKQQAYWLKEFAGEIPVLNLPYDYPRPTLQGFAGETVTFELERQHLEALNQLVNRENVTLFMVLLALFNILLGKLSSQEDIITGIPAAGRVQPDLEPIIGMFVSTLALRNYPYAGYSFTGFLSQVKTRTLKAFENQDYPFEHLVEKTTASRDPGRNPIFDVMFALHNMRENTGFRGKQGNRSYENKISRFDMTWMASGRQEQLDFEIEYCTNLFKSETIRKFSDYFKKIIAAVTANPGIRIGQIEIISTEEKKQILYRFNDTACKYPADRTIHRLFEEQVKKTPHQIALAGEMPRDVKEAKSLKQVSNDIPRMHLTYCELNEKAHRLALYLREDGVENETIVGIVVEQSIDLIIGLLAVLKADGVYLPIDPAYPEERIEYMLADSSAKILVTSGFLAERVKKFKKNPETILIDSLREFNFSSSHLLNFSTFHLPNLPPSHSTTLAYILYTSGSTGRPKGVMVRHQNVVRLVKNSNFIDISSDDRLLPTGNIVFDISTFETWWPLLNGLTIYPVNQHIILETEKLENFMIKNRISILHLIPQLFNQLSGQRIEIFAGLKYFLVGGDLVQPQYVNILRNTYPHIKILHMYGPTENTTFSTFYPVNRDYQTAIPIGKPISNSVVAIVDKFDKLVPIGIPGELLVGGDGVARGYLNNPGLTAERFILTTKSQRHKDVHFSWCPGALAAKFYKTGDLARWQPDGDIEFLGRIDQQVKIRGSRIEPGEIENRLLEHPRVKQAVVTFNRDETGEKFLIAYIVTDSADLKVTDRLRDFLLQKLPGSMIPSYFLLLDNIPLTPNGKVDVKALPEPGTVKSDKIIAHSRSDIEKELVKIWAEVLNISPSEIGIDNNFFQLGGHSLKAARMMAKIQTRLNTRLSLPEIFKFPSIRQLGPLVSRAGTTRIFIPNVEKQEYYQVSYNQERLWNFQCQYPGSNAYNLFNKIPFMRSIPVKGIRETLGKLIRRHESFRTRFRQVNGRPVQFIETHVDLPLEIIDLSSLPGEKKQLEAEKIFKGNCQKSFDLTSSPLFRAILLKMGDSGDEFILIMHHIISDGWSHELLKKEFQAYYQGFLAGKEITLEPQPLQYRDFAGWQRQRFRDSAIKEKVLQYWKSKFEQGFPVLALPFDAGGNPEDRSGITYRSVIPQEIKKPLRHLVETHQTSLFMILFSAFNRLMSSISGQTEIVCRVPAAGRDKPELQDIMGYLVNSVIIKNHVIENEPFIDLLHRVTGNTLTAFRYQWYPLELVLENLHRESPQITVSFNMLSMLESAGETDMEHRESYFTGDIGEAKFPLILRIIVYRNGIEITWSSQKALFKPATLENMARQYVQILKVISKEAVDIEFSR